jgi:hypothetical protein
VPLLSDGTSMSDKNLEKSREETPASAIKNTYRSYIAIILLLLPILASLSYIFIFGVNVPFWDEWGFTPVLNDFYTSHLSFDDLFQQHNEHRIFFPQLVMLGDSYLTQYDVKDLMYMSFLVSMVTFIVIAYMYFKKAGKGLMSLALFIPVSFIFFSLRQFENILWGWQIQIYLCVLGSIASLFFIGRSKRADVNLIMATLFAIMATFSFINGLLVWPIVLFYLLVNGRYKLSAIWAALGLAAWCAFFYGWSHPGYHPPMSYSFFHPVEAAHYLLVNIGAPFAFEVYFATLAGFIILALYLLTFILVIKNKSIEENSFWISLILFALGSSVLCMIGRSGFGIDQAMTSRYTTFSILGVIGLYIMIADEYLKLAVNRMVYKASLGILLVIIIIGLIAGNAYGLYEGKKMMDSRQYEISLLKNMNSQDINQMTSIYPDPIALTHGVSVLEKYHLSIFSNT